MYVDKLKLCTKKYDNNIFDWKFNCIQSFQYNGIFYDAKKLLKLVPTYCLRPSFSSFHHSKQPNSIANNAQVKWVGSCMLEFQCPNYWLWVRKGWFWELHCFVQG
jgi:hypothetical protein